MKRADGTSEGRGRPRLTLNKSQRLKGRKTFDTVYRTGTRRIAHPLAATGLRRADNGPSRVGISIGRKVGNAVMRNRIKRLLREAYRQMQHELPIGTDWLIVVRPHAPLAVGQYQEKLRQLLR